MPQSLFWILLLILLIILLPILLIFLPMLFGKVEKA
jgi:hypothetical protein